jgi:hypothetical protein
MSRKPEFFSYNMPLYEVVTPDGLMRPVLAARLGGLYCGGSARQVGRHSERGFSGNCNTAQDRRCAFSHVGGGTTRLHDEHNGGLDDAVCLTFTPPWHGSCMPAVRHVQ